MTGRNLIHGSDGPESAQREVALFFGDHDVPNGCEIPIAGFSSSGQFTFHVKR